jgi:hypothetical protein
MIGVNVKKFVTVILAGLLVVLLISGAPVRAEDETDVDAEVEVLPAGGTIYGARIVGLRSVLFPRWALGEPDGWGASIFRNGWLSIELEDNVPNTDAIIIWAANRGWWPSRMKVYVSADGRRWKQVGNEKVTSAGFQRFDFTGSFGGVKYIKVCRSGWPWSWIPIDAVGAEGGDTS